MKRSNRKQNIFKNNNKETKKPKNDERKSFRNI